VQTKFNIDQLVYVIRSEIKTEWDECPACDGRGALLVDGIPEICNCHHGTISKINTITIVRDFLIKKIVISDEIEIYYYDDDGEEDTNYAFIESKIFATREEAEASRG
jgi:hypothetical protein